MNPTGNFLYRLPASIILPGVVESKDKIDLFWRLAKLGSILLELNSFALTKKPFSRRGLTLPHLANLLTFSGTHINKWSKNCRRPSGEDYKANRERAEEELEKTGRIKGSVFLTPSLDKVWLSHYDIRFLEIIPRHEKLSL